MVILTITIESHQNKREELLHICRMTINQSRKEKGMTGARILKDLDDENIIKIENTWGLRSQLDDYLNSDRFNTLIEAVKLLGRSHEIRLDEGSYENGKRAIEDARVKDGINTERTN